jgi:uncharacterized protein
MLVVISPAKAMRLDESARAAVKAAPRFASVADALAASLASVPAAGLAKMMDLSPSLASLNAERYGSWAAQPTVAAAWAMDGPAFKALDARSLAPGAADRTVRVLSGLYGLLRPTDAIKPYRLEMGSALRAPGTRAPADLAGGCASLYDFWGARVAHGLEADLAAAEKDAGVTPGSGVIVNAASQEYWKAVAGHFKPGTRVVTAVFPGPAVHAKAARGALARFAAELGSGSKAAGVEGLKGFTGSAGEWSYDAGASDGDRLVFVRGAAKAGGAKKAAAAKAAAAKRGGGGGGGGGGAKKAKK